MANTNNISKNGRIPVNSSNKAPESTDFTPFEFNVLNIDGELRQELEKKGLVPRWVDAKRYYDAGNMHKSGWKAYRREGSPAEKGALSFRLGDSPDGYVIRNGMLLAVKTKAESAGYRRYVQQRTNANSGGNAESAQALREMARDHGVGGVKVHEGYEDNGGSDADDD